MTLIELIQKRTFVAIATAIPATPATEKFEGRLSVATVAVATPHRDNDEPLSPHQIQTDKADTVGEVPTLSGMAVHDPAVSTQIIPSVSANTPPQPLQAGWRIVYRDHRWRLAGGSDDPDHGTVKECRWSAGRWVVHLTDGQAIPQRRVRSVGAVDRKGQVYAAWTVREHGLDGEGRSKREEKGA